MSVQVIWKESFCWCCTFSIWRRGLSHAGRHLPPGLMCVSIMRLRSRALLMQLERACFESAALSWLCPSVGGRMLKAQKLKAWYNLCCSHSYLVKLAHFAGGQCCDRSSLALIPLRPDWPAFSGGLAHASPSDNSMCTLLTWLTGGKEESFQLTVQQGELVALLSPGRFSLPLVLKCQAHVLRPRAWIAAPFCEKRY